MKEKSAPAPKTQSLQTKTISHRLASGQPPYYVHARFTMEAIREILPPRSIKSLSLQYSALLATHRGQRQAFAGAGGGGGVGGGSTDSGV